MIISELKSPRNIEENSKLKNIYNQFDKYLNELRKKELSDNLILSVNKNIDTLNSSNSSEKYLRKEIKKVQTKTVSLVEKDSKIVPKNYYRNLWLVLGMTAFGLPFGVLFGMVFKNMIFLSMGLPIGMGIGIAVGTGMDKKAIQEGRQLDVEIKY